MRKSKILYYMNNVLNYLVPATLSPLFRVINVNNVSVQFVCLLFTSAKQRFSKKFIFPFSFYNEMCYHFGIQMDIYCTEENFLEVCFSNAKKSCISLYFRDEIFNY